jgi:hypothetical protein
MKRKSHIFGMSVSWGCGETRTRKKSAATIKTSNFPLTSETPATDGGTALGSPQ